MRKFVTVVMGVALMFLLVPANEALAQAGSYTLGVAKPFGDGDVTLTFTANGVTQTVKAKGIKATDTVDKKLEKIKKALEAKGYTVAPGNGAGGAKTLKITNLPNGTTATFNPGKTGESKDQLVKNNAEEPPADKKGTVGIKGSFPSTGLDGLASRFTAGVVTDWGEVSVEYVAEDFPPGAEIPGDWIAQELFMSLVDAAAALGAFVELQGDELHIFYDPAASQERSGVIFGTTSEGDGIEAGIEVL